MIEEGTQLNPEEVS